ncbi:hypothetical protein QBC38DRAFT_456206, partial [Podospora fimiseda]
MSAVGPTELPSFNYSEPPYQVIEWNYCQPNGLQQSPTCFRIGKGFDDFLRTPKGGSCPPLIHTINAPEIPGMGTNTGDGEQVDFNFDKAVQSLREYRSAREKDAAQDPPDNYPVLPAISFHSVLATLKTTKTRIGEQLVLPTNNLLDMLYKSIAIRDSRLSLELNASLWRLSWIRFIFLPLTFLSGFFGMNVDVFANSPSIKWYFIAAAGV